MNWDSAIERHRVPLLGIVLALVAEIGLTRDSTAARLSKPVYQYALRQLRKAESAVRRLIYVAARNIVIEPPAEDPARARPKVSSKDKAKPHGEAKPKRKRRFLFRLFDPPRRFRFFGRLPKRKRVLPPLQVVNVGSNPLLPLYLVFRLQEPPPAPPPPVAENEAGDGMVDATKLIRRFAAVVDALQDIPRHAMRLALWRARPPEERRPPRSSPLRSGRPPGFRERPKHEIDEILKECDWLARNVQPPLDDTS